MTPHYLCKSYVDDNNELQDCTCGKCASLVNDVKLIFGKRVPRELPRDSETKPIATNKTSSIYTLENGHEEIGVEVDRSGKITLINPYTQNSEFVFKGSDPERLARMGNLLIEASKLRI